MKRWLRILAGTGVGIAAALLVGLRASAATLALTPASVGPVGIGATIVLDVVVDGVGGSAANAIGAFDLDLAYDPSVVSFVGFAYEPYLGVAPGEVLVASGASGGTIDLGAVSLLAAGDLVALQPSTFVLGHVTLQAVGVGASLLTFTQTELSDADGVFLLSIEAATGAALEVVPEPSVALLVGAGVVALARRRRARSHAAL